MSESSSAAPGNEGATPATDTEVSGGSSSAGVAMTAKRTEKALNPKRQSLNGLASLTSSGGGPTAVNGQNSSRAKDDSSVAAAPSASTTLQSTVTRKTTGVPRYAAEREKDKVDREKSQEERRMLLEKQASSEQPRNSLQAHMQYDKNRIRENNQIKDAEKKAHYILSYKYLTGTPEDQMPTDEKKVDAVLRPDKMSEEEVTTVDMSQCANTSNPLMKMLFDIHADAWIEPKGYNRPDLPYPPNMKLCDLLWTDRRATMHLFNYTRIALYGANMPGPNGTIVTNQRVVKTNFLPGMIDFTSKSFLARKLTLCRSMFQEAFDFFPLSWVLPANILQFKKDFDEQLDLENGSHTSTYIMKPNIGSKGDGIKLVKTWNDVTNMMNVMRKEFSENSMKNQTKKHAGVEGGVTIQQYIQNPMLLDGLKFDFRCYVVVQSLDPLQIFVYREGLARFATQKYVCPGKNNMNSSYMHLTNYSLNKDSATFVNSNVENQEFSEHGTKRTISTTLQQIREANFALSDREFWRQVDDIAAKTLIAIWAPMWGQFKQSFPDWDRNVHRKDPNLSPCFNVVGFDLMLDGNLKLWLLEINAQPSLHIESPFDLAIKLDLTDKALQLLGVLKPVPVNEGKGGKENHLLRDEKTFKMRGDEIDEQNRKKKEDEVRKVKEEEERVKSESEAAERERGRLEREGSTEGDLGDKSSGDDNTEGGSNGNAKDVRDMAFNKGSEKDKAATGPGAAGVKDGGNQKDKEKKKLTQAEKDLLEKEQLRKQKAELQAATAAAATAALKKAGKRPMGVELNKPPPVPVPPVYAYGGTAETKARRKAMLDRSGAQAGSNKSGGKGSDDDEEDDEESDSEDEDKPKRAYRSPLMALGQLPARLPDHHSYFVSMNVETIPEYMEMMVFKNDGMEEVFDAYTAVRPSKTHAGGRSTGTLPINMYIKLLQDSGLLSGKTFSRGQATVLYVQLTQKRKDKTMEYSVFCECMMQIAKIKYPGLSSDVQAMRMLFKHVVKRFKLMQEKPQYGGAANPPDSPNGKWKGRDAGAADSQGVDDDADGSSGGGGGGGGVSYTRDGRRTYRRALLSGRSRHSMMYSSMNGNMHDGNEEYHEDGPPYYHDEHGNMYAAQTQGYHPHGNQHHMVGGNGSGGYNAGRYGNYVMSLGHNKVECAPLIPTNFCMALNGGGSGSSSSSSGSSGSSGSSSSNSNNAGATYGSHNSHNVHGFLQGMQMVHSNPNPYGGHMPNGQGLQIHGLPALGASSSSSMLTTSTHPTNNENVNNNNAQGNGGNNGNNPNNSNTNSNNTNNNNNHNNGATNGGTGNGAKSSIYSPVDLNLTAGLGAEYGIFGATTLSSHQLQLMQLQQQQQLLSQISFLPLQMQLQQLMIMQQQHQQSLALPPLGGAFGGPTFASGPVAASKNYLYTNSMVMAKGGVNVNVVNLGGGQPDFGMFNVNNQMNNMNISSSSSSSSASSAGKGKAGAGSGGNGSDHVKYQLRSVAPRVFSFGGSLLAGPSNSSSNNSGSVTGNSTVNSNTASGGKHSLKTNNNGTSAPNPNYDVKETFRGGHGAGNPNPTSISGSNEDGENGAGAGPDDGPQDKSGLVRITDFGGHKTPSFLSEDTPRLDGAGSFDKVLVPTTTQGASSSSIKSQSVLAAQSARVQRAITTTKK